MKQLIINAINSNRELRGTLEILNQNQDGAIMRRYKELHDRKHPEETETSKYILGIIFSSGPDDIRHALQVWIESDIWLAIQDRIEKKPEDYEYKICLYEALDELRLNRALHDFGPKQYKNIMPPKPLTEKPERLYRPRPW